MSSPYIGEIRMFAGNFAPAGWAFCMGQLMPISENDTLFNLIGTTYGGDGQETFALPDLSSRIPLHVGTLVGNTYQLGEKAGVETVTLTVAQMPAHSHAALAASGGLGATSNLPKNRLLSEAGGDIYTPTAPNLSMNPATVGSTGGSLPHNNVQPYLCINFIISLFGIFPSQI